MAWRYAVLAFGDRNYDAFCVMAQLDARLLEARSNSLLERVDCDAEFQPAADAWLERSSRGSRKKTRHCMRSRQTE